MAKISLNKMLKIKEVETKPLTINGYGINVKQYLPVTEKTDCISDILAESFDDNGFLSPVRFSVLYDIMLLKYYTDIGMTEKMLTEKEKLYDGICMNHIADMVKDVIPTEELEAFNTLLNDTKDTIIQYNTSIAGLLKNVVTDYSATNMNVEETLDKLNDPEKVGLVKAVLEKMG